MMQQLLQRWCGILEQGVWLLEQGLEQRCYGVLEANLALHQGCCFFTARLLPFFRARLLWR